jgi:hypothetical protein
VRLLPFCRTRWIFTTALSKPAMVMHIHLGQRRARDLSLFFLERGARV